jgi:hypothetical protein
MKKINGKKGVTIFENEKFTEPVTIKDSEDCKIVNCDFSSNESGQAMLHLSDCVRCTISKCKFHDKNTIGVALKIDGPKTKDNIVEDSEWWNLTFAEGNGGEPVRLGNSRVSHLFFNTMVRNCTFRELLADVETVSIKSCGNTVENCNHSNCQSSIVIRHGHTNTIQNNEFIGEGGVRCHGKDNKILGNHFKENDSKKFPPIILVNGNTKDEPNEGASGSAEGHASYTQVRNCEISGNTFENCKRVVLWGRDPRQFKPEGVKFKNNKVIAENKECLVVEFTGGAKAEGNEGSDNQVVGTKARIHPSIAKWFTDVKTEIIIQNPGSGDEDEDERIGGASDKGQDPTIAPQIDSEPIARECCACEALGIKNEAKQRLSVHVCSEHVPAAAEAMRISVSELQKKAKETPPDLIQT